MNVTARSLKHLSAGLTLAALLGGCASGPFQRGDGAPNVHVNVAAIPDPVPHHEPRSRLGNPATYVVHGKTYKTLNSSKGFVQRGIASWYGTKFHGRRTSNGENYNMYAMTAAHKTLPLPTYVEVTNLDNGRHVIVRVNDRGPFHEGRIIDLSYAAAIKLGINKHGTGRVEIRAIDPDHPSAHRLAARPATPATSPVVAAAPAADAADSSGHNLYLQVGAFSSRLNAENLRRRLAQMANSPVHIFPGGAPGQPVYRVRIGPLANDREAEQLSSRLLSQGISNPSVIFD
jgi:rare lipoprotein A